MRSADAGPGSFVGNAVVGLWSLVVGNTATRAVVIGNPKLMRLSRNYHGEEARAVNDQYKYQKLGSWASWPTTKDQRPLGLTLYLLYLYTEG
jgi:hypothetical protein